MGPVNSTEAYSPFDLNQNSEIVGLAEQKNSDNNSSKSEQNILDEEEGFDNLGTFKLAKADRSQVQNKIKVNIEVETKKMMEEAARKARETKKTSKNITKTKIVENKSAASLASGTNSGSKVLSTGKSMVENGVIVRGSCWDFVNAVYNRAGYGSSRRVTIFNSGERGPYASQNKIQPGDWLMYKNLSYHNIGHSAIFVRWTDYNKKQALMLSYAGGNRGVTARYKVYDVSKTYVIIRAR